MNNQPSTNLRLDFAANLDRLINGSNKTQAQIATALGYSNPNIITMFKSGTTRVPIDMVEPLAQQLDVDPAMMLRDWLDAYMPGSRPMLERLLR